jgi:hypothetical protein
VHAVNASLFDRARAERFAQLLDEADGGRRHHAHSRLDEELAELVNEARLLRRIPIQADPDPIFKRDLRAMLIAAAERLWEPLDDASEVRSRFARPRARGAIVMGIAAGTLALSGVSVASGEAKPGDALYGMKRSTERAQLALAGSDLMRGQLYLDFAATRLDEASGVRDNLRAFIDALGEMNGETQRGVSLLVSTAASKHDATALDAIDNFVNSQRKELSKLLRDTKGQSRDKVSRSLTLLDAVAQRSAAARSALACGAKPTDSDTLGPIFGDCQATATVHPAITGRSASASGQSASTGKKHAPETSMSVTSPAKGGNEQEDADDQGNADGSDAKKKDDGLLGELGRILGGLLGG